MSETPPAPTRPSSSPPPSRPGANGARPKPWTRKLPWIGGALLFALIVAGLWPRAQPVESGTVSRGPLAVTVSDEGRTRVRNSFVVSAPISGQLRRIELKPGAPVVAGETVVAVLETSGADLLDARGLAQAEARVRAANSAREMASAQRERANAAAKLATAELARAKQLSTEGTLSKQELDWAVMRETTAAQDARAASFALQVAEFDLEQARATLLRGQNPAAAGETATVTIVAPVAGRVMRVWQESSRVVARGTPLLEIGDPTDLEVVVEVLSRDAVAVKPGARVSLERWGGEQPLQARVRHVEPSGFTKISALGVEEQRVNVIVDFVDPIEKRPTLGDAFRVEASIVTWESGDVLQVPSGALFQRSGKWQTFVIDGGRARLKDVEIGHNNGISAELRAGLDAGTKVIVFPGDKVSAGVRVSPVQRE